MTTSALSPLAVTGGRTAQGGAWLWSTVLWILFTLYCIFLLVQVVDKTKHPVQSTSYEIDNGFSAPSILLCSFGSFDLSYFEAEFPSLYGGRWQVMHNFSDMLGHSVANYSKSDTPVVPKSDVHEAYGCNDLITFSENLADDDSHGVDTPDYNSSFVTPQLLGMVRSAAVIAPSKVERWNNMGNTKWCVMWTPYRLSLRFPPSESSSNNSVDTGSVWNRQLDSSQVYRVAINLNGAAVQQDKSWQWVSTDRDGGRLQSNTKFPPILSVQFVDFGGTREEEWQQSSLSSIYMRNALKNNDPDGFQLVTLNNNHELSVQKQVTTSLSSAQKLGWPWTAWPWSDDSQYQQTQYKVQSTTSALLEEKNGQQPSVTGPTGSGDGWTHTLVVGLVRSTKQTLFVTDVPAVVGLLGNFGGAYSLMVVLYGLFYAIKSPHVETGFQLPGQDFAMWLWSYSKKWRCIGGCHKYTWWRPMKSKSGPDLNMQPDPHDPVV